MEVQDGVIYAVLVGLTSSVMEIRFRHIDVFFLLDAALTRVHTQQVESRFNQRRALKKTWRTDPALVREVRKLHTAPAALRQPDVVGKSLNIFANHVWALFLSRRLLDPTSQLC